MDRVKFRIWDIKQQKYRQRTHHEADTCLNCLTGKVLFGEGIEIYGEEEDKDVIPEQCTGLKDKNGKLIYEGDFLGGLYGGYISWCDKCKSFELFFPEFGCAGCNGDVLWQEIVEDDGMLEILGNIHENADLLEN